ncbi:MAG: toll/interleukin-1 receptor domain-containing protein [Algoriphagus sp.]|uniref:toll/interleukin-1 receptor domain-containing protein n=1 Tax=Algoriphagus sp. TaxID=1872435 RepID=UPI0026321C46|nr:toll/interleukin-1 receptor domain-containing protein [Algoriphagus sp.]MDG1277807.1 toll/interleukin-1 receptor domain-containing protein [Algoriphagus sp.]
MGLQQVFISYAWGGESEQVANELEAILKSNQIDLIRDKNNLGFKGLIREFMEQIGKGDFVVLIISDKYLKSKNCMFELMEVAKRGSFLDRIFPIVLPDAAIYDGLGILSYLKYWDKKLKDLNASAKELDSLEKINTIQTEINLFAEIRTAIDELAGTLSNMNTLSIEIMRSKSYQPLIEALKSSVSDTTETPAPTSSRKEGKVLYHIPGTMQVLSWTRCTVRLAWEEILLKEGLKIPEEEQVIESIRLGEIMQVSLNEGQSGSNFEIKALNNEEQFILSDDFTEWLFDVKPLVAGDFILILRVTLIQIILGKERKKDIVLERNVKTAANVPKALAKYETAESNLSPPEFSFEYSGSEEVKMESKIGDLPIPKNTPTSFSKPTVSSPSPSIPKAGGKSIFKKILPYAASLAGIILIAFFFFPSYDSSSPDFVSVDNTSSPDSNFEELNPNISMEFPKGLENNQNVMIAMSLESIVPSGEIVTEVGIFKVSPETLEELWQADLGDFTLTLFSDSLNNPSNNPIEELNFVEIVDSLSKIKSAPLIYENRIFERKELKNAPQIKNRIIIEKKLDSGEIQRIKRSKGKIQEN